MRLRAQRFSRPPRSTTPAPLRGVRHGNLERRRLRSIRARAFARGPRRRGRGRTRQGPGATGTRCHRARRVIRMTTGSCVHVVAQLARLDRPADPGHGHRRAAAACSGGELGRQLRAGAERLEDQDVERAAAPRPARSGTAGAQRARGAPPRRRWRRPRRARAPRPPTPRTPARRPPRAVPPWSRSARRSSRGSRPRARRSPAPRSRRTRARRRAPWPPRSAPCASARTAPAWRTAAGRLSLWNRDSGHDSELRSMLTDQHRYEGGDDGGNLQGGADHRVLDRDRARDRGAPGRSGWKVYATARRPESIEDLRRRAARRSPSTSPTRRRCVLRSARWRRPRAPSGVLVNNAGYSQSGAVESVQPGRRARAVRDERVRPGADVPARAARHAPARAGARS